MNVRTHQHYVSVCKDKLTVEFFGKGRFCDPGSVQAESAAAKDCVLYYFEAEILNSEKQSKIVVGFSGANYHLNRYPGVDGRSVGYRSENGHCSNGSGKWEPYGAPYGKGDVVGCGINYLEQCYFFTKNGKYQGEFGKLHHCDNFPTVGLSHFADSVKCNFIGPFKFDAAREYRRIMGKERIEISSMKSDHVSLDDIVESYFLSRGYKNALRAFQRERRLFSKKREGAETSTSSSAQPPGPAQGTEPQETGSRAETPGANKRYLEQLRITDAAVGRLESTVDRRHMMSRLVTSGETMEALNMLHAVRPDVDRSSYAYCRVVTQRFLDLALQGQVVEAVSWLRSTFDFSTTNKPQFKRLLEVRFKVRVRLIAAQEAMEVLCYKEVRTPALSDCYGARRRRLVAHDINDLANGRCRQSALTPLRRRGRTQKQLEGVGAVSDFGPPDSPLEKREHWAEVHAVAHLPYAVGGRVTRPFCVIGRRPCTP
ncbi:SPRY domain-containing protein [Babesia caballi]|uniref:SPRY domain-containing protein n=1 Tax=Babesia caballi TaxID=5871 RepID=A0AAV4LSG1_BABCB|nr:SPRY domain-containing protein [Babesia caballi]